MKGKLIKTIDGYELFTQGFLKGSTNHGLIDSLNIEEGPIRYKLSLRNSQAIERGYDLNELISESNTSHLALFTSDSHELMYDEGFKAGFQKCLELIGDKKFSEDDMINAHFNAWIDRGEQITYPNSKNRYFKSLQQTEWDVEIEMVCPHPSDTYRCGIQYGCDEDGCNHPNQVPYLDSDGCLILKRT